MLVTLIGEVDALVQDLAKGLKSDFYNSMESWVKIARAICIGKVDR
jgi:hypothetical protein